MGISMLALAAVVVAGIAATAVLVRR
jgi:hypothetical protein